MQDMIGVAFALLAIAFFGLSSRPAQEAAAAIVGCIVLVVVAAWVLPRLLQALKAEHDLFLMLSVASGFAVLFFVLLGSLIDPRAIPRALPWIAFLLAAVVVAKALPAAVLSRLARLPDVRHGQLGIGLGQVGEFSFVLAGILLARGLITVELFTAMLAMVVLTIAASAVLVRVGNRPVAAAA